MDELVFRGRGPAGVMEESPRVSRARSQSLAIRSAPIQVPDHLALLPQVREDEEIDGFRNAPGMEVSIAPAPHRVGARRGGGDGKVVLAVVEETGNRIAACRVRAAHECLAEFRQILLLTEEPKEDLRVAPRPHRARLLSRGHVWDLARQVQHPDGVRDLEARSLEIERLQAWIRRTESLSHVLRRFGIELLAARMQVLAAQPNAELSPQRLAERTVATLAQDRLRDLDTRSREVDDPGRPRRFVLPQELDGLAKHDRSVRVGVPGKDELPVRSPGDDSRAFTRYMRRGRRLRLEHEDEPLEEDRGQRRDELLGAADVVPVEEAGDPRVGARVVGRGSICLNPGEAGELAEEVRGK